MTLKFKSEEERAKAYEEIPDVDDAPPGVKLDEWQEEMEKRIEEIDEAEIDEEFQSEPSEEENQNAGSEPEVTDSGSNESVPETNFAQARIDNLQEERKAMMAQFEKERNDMANKIKNLEEKFNSSSSTHQPDTEPEPDKKIQEKDQEISNIQKQIDELEEAMNDVDDPFDEDVQKAVVKSSRLNSRLNRLMAEKYKIELSNNAKEIRELRERQEKDKRQLEEDQELKAQQKAQADTRAKTVKMLESFRNKEEFKSKKSFDALENEYANFAMDCAIADTGKAPNEITASDSEKAVQKYLDKTPLLLEKIREKGISEPEDMREFLIMSDVNALRMGVQLNKHTGEWNELLNDDGKQISFPDMESAYDYYKKQKGITGQELLNAERRAAKNIMAAIQKRANVKELNEAHETDRVEDMDKDMASKIISEWDEEEVIEIARRDINSKKVQTYNKALMTMGLDPIEEGF